MELIVNTAECFTKRLDFRSENLQQTTDIKNRLKLFNNTHVFEQNISEKPFSVLSGWQLKSD